MYDNFFFDFDGTLVDTGEGIINSFLYSFEKMNIKGIKREDVRAIVGAPLHYMFQKLTGVNEELFINECIKYYRERYNTQGILEAVLFEGTDEILKLLKDKDKKIFIMSNKPSKYIKEISDRLEITHFYNEIYGTIINEKAAPKKERFMKVINDNDYNPNKSIMIGDTIEDVETGIENNVDSAVLLHGYGSDSELKKSGAKYIFESNIELIEFLRYNIN